MIIGHSNQQKNLIRLLREQKLPQTILFSGAAGTGKQLVGRALSKALLCTSGGRQFESSKVEDCCCDQCRSCHIFDAGNHPDFHFIDCQDRQNWNTAAIRQLIFDLHLSAFSGSHRVVLFNDAESMPLQGANALLKSLEEPARGLYFVLVSASRARLPQTLLSRCQVWFFERLAEAEMIEIFKRSSAEKYQTFKKHLGASELSFDELALLSDGSMQNIADILDHVGDWRRIQKILPGAAKGELTRAFSYVKEIARDRKLLRTRIQLMRIIARSYMRAESEHCEKFRWSHCVQNLLNAENLIFNRNMNAGYLLEQVLLDLSLPSSRMGFSEYPTSIRSLVEGL